MTITFGRDGRPLRALDSVDLQIARGERIALLGRSGAGKSTLLRALLGAVPASGTVSVDGSDPYGPDVRRIRRATGVLRQGDDLIPQISARLNALLGTVPSWRVRDWVAGLAGRVPKAYIGPLDELAVRHGIDGCLTAPAAELSGGQRQRVALVRALLPGPRLLLADEPTAGLDPVTAAEAVRALREADATVLVATHDLEVARGFDRMLALRDGRVVYDGPATADPEIVEEIYR